MDVRIAGPGDELDVRRLIDGAMLECDRLDERVESGSVLVAITDAGRIVGTIVADASFDESQQTEVGSRHVIAIAVQRERRDSGIGERLVEDALERSDRITARFDSSVRPFYESLDFQIEPIDDGRFEGRLDRDRYRASDTTADGKRKER